jgi:hypothetical protein
MLAILAIALALSAPNLKRVDTFLRTGRFWSAPVFTVTSRRSSMMLATLGSKA